MYRTLEVLEARIAPAAVFTYTEADGDVVTIKTSARINDVDFAVYLATHATFSDGPGEGDLLSLDLSDPVFRNSSLTITTTKVGDTDGLASIGDIDANVDLKNVVIQGNVRSIEVGDMNYATVGVKNLQVQNLGSEEGECESTYIYGGAKSVSILGDLNTALYAGYNEGGGTNIGAIKISGSLGPEGFISARKIGTLAVGKDLAGAVEADAIKAVRITGNLVGTTSSYSGTIYADSIKSVRIGGDIIGGSGVYSGGIEADYLGSVLVGGSVIGGDGGHSGYIYGDDEIGKVIVLGSVIGGSGDLSGIIESEGDAGLIRVDGDLVAGTGDVSGSIALVYHDTYYYEYFDEELDMWVEEVYFDYFEYEGYVDKIVVGGSLYGATGVEIEPEVTVFLGGEDSGSIIARGIGSLRIGGSLVGGVDEGSGSVSGGYLGTAIIGGDIIGGDDYRTGGVEFGGIGSIRVGGSVTGGWGYAAGGIVGYDGIGSIRIAGDLEGGYFGGGNILSEYGSIESIVIGGSFLGKEDYYFGDKTGIYANGSIDRITIGGNATGAEYGSFGIHAGYSHPGTSSVPGIGSVTIKGNVTNFVIESGPGSNGDINYDASIGTVNIGGDFIRSAIAAGVEAAFDGFYGTEDDMVDVYDPSVLSRIASVVIGGNAYGTPANEIDSEDPVNFDNYGIFAQHLVALKVGGKKQGLLTGATNDLTAALVNGVADVKYSELPLTKNIT